MLRLSNPPDLVLLVCLVGVTCAAQSRPAQKSRSDDSPISSRSIELAESGHCAQALPMLKSAMRQPADKDLKRRLGLDGVHCAMTVHQPEEALDFLRTLTREFPRDPEVLYVAVHAYSDLSTKFSQTLARDAPDSYEAHELNAEALEVRGEWDQAAKEYRWILEKNPRAPGIHFRMGRLLLSKPNPGPTMAEDAKKEFKQELEIDPSNAGAEYVLGELARQAQQWDDAIAHFSRAAKLDPGFADASMGLGMSLLSVKKYAEAIPPLQNAAKLQPENPATHYNLAMAYSRAGQKEQAAEEFALHRKTAAAAQAARDSQAPQPLPAAEAPQ